jgi:hypothetical protein
MKIKIEEIAREQGLTVRVACVEGDDLSRSDVLSTDIKQNMFSANAYLGAVPVAAALEQGADIVITGRSVDSALALAATKNHFAWGWTDYDLLAQASLAGHVIECGTQCTGGNFTDWRRIKSPDDMGFPIVRIEADGGF